MSGPTLIIAEAGVNHNGCMDTARKLIDVAATAGADLVKFQTFTADSLATPSAQKAQYQLENTGASENQREMLQRLELNDAMHRELVAYCERCDIGFFSTGFDIQSIDYLAELGADRFKVPSGELNNLPYLRHLASHGKPVILSSGMATLGEVEAAIDCLVLAGLARGDIVLLHCTTEYPTPMLDVNLKAMQTLATTFGVQVGYSDHTLGIEVSTAAVALGATVIEKHFTLDRSMPGPDHKASLEPGELVAMISAIRNIEQALGDGIKKPTASEIAQRAVVRKSLVALKKIGVGDTFTNQNVTCMRPGTGISPMRWDEVIGRHASREFQPFELIQL